MRAWILWLIMGLSSITAVAAQLTNVALSQVANQTTLYFTIDGAFTHKIFTLNNPQRVVIDLKDANLKVNLKQLGLTNELIKQVRSGQPDTKTLRLVFDTNQMVKVSSSPWHLDGTFKGVRVDLVRVGNVAAPLDDAAARAAELESTRTPIMQVSQNNKLPIKVANKITKLPIKPKPIAQEPTIPYQPITHQTPIKSHSPSQSLRDVVVVLDAGHGGKDPGAKGPRNSKEKHVVLAITLKLKQLIDKQPGMRAVLTRTGDYYVGLRQRLDIARKYNGDIFVSIHADAFNNPHSNGASVFALSQSGATSEAARWIAEKENYSELGGVNLGDLDDTNGVVRSVLIDLSQTATINAGLQMGGRVLNQLDDFTRLHNNKVEQARFMVLKSPDIPSILVETGFISNPIEEKNLTNPSYQARLSLAIFQGVKGYFWDNPPHGTRIEAMTSNNYHLVRAGETWPAIAARYHVSIVAMQKINHMSNRERLKPGQKLAIPSQWS